MGNIVAVAVGAAIWRRRRRSRRLATPPLDKWQLDCTKLTKLSERKRQLLRKCFQKKWAHTHTSDCLQKFWQWCFFLPQTKEAMDQGEIFVFFSSYFARKYDMSYEKYTKTFQSSELPNGKNIIRNIIVRSKFEK